MWRPQTSASSPVLTTTVRSRGSRSCASPRTSFAAPVPPARATMFTTGSGLADGARPGAGPAPRRAPESGAAPPAIEAKARTVAEGGWQLGLGNRNEAGADPDPIEPLGSREHGVDLIALGQECGDEM